MRWPIAALAFLVSFAAIFLLAGWFILPHVPPTPAQPVSAMTLAYWLPNWPGYVLGLIIGLLSARATLREPSAQL